jgi:hypothetical protein
MLFHQAMAGKTAGAGGAPCLYPITVALAYWQRANGAIQRPITQRGTVMRRPGTLPAAAAPIHANGIIARMRGFFKIKRLHVWLACLAILMNVLAPSISYAISQARHSQSTHLPASSMEICSMDDAHSVMAADDQPQAPADSPDNPHAHASSHCPFCASHGGNVALPSSAMPALFASAGSAILPVLFYHAPRPLFAWATANPRAPPTTL